MKIMTTAALPFKVTPQEIVWAERHHHEVICAECNNLVLCINCTDQLILLRHNPENGEMIFTNEDGCSGIYSAHNAEMPEYFVNM